MNKTSLAEILEQFYEDAFTETEENGKLNNSLRRAIAAIEALVPEKHGETSYHYWRGHDDAIDHIHQNFNGQTTNERKQA